MLALFASLILLSSKVFAIDAVSNAGIQKISYSTNLVCYHENAQNPGYAVIEGFHSEPAVCDIPAHRTRTSNIYAYTLHYLKNGTLIPSNMTVYPLVIEFNETLTRQSLEDPLKNVIEGDGIVTSQAFNGYRAKQLIITLWDQIYEERNGDLITPPPTVCEANGGYKQTLYSSTYLAVYPESLSAQSMSDIHSNFTYKDMSGVNSLQTLWHNTMNDTGMLCFAPTSTHYTTSNMFNANTLCVNE